MIHPKETAWWYSEDPKGTLIPMENQTIYQNDFFGLKTVAEAGKIKRVELPGEHLQFSKENITDLFIPFLKNGVNRLKSRPSRLRTPSWAASEGHRMNDAYF